MNLTLPEQVDALFSKLRSAIRRYVLLRGLAVILVSLVLVFWVTLFVDTAWFSSTKLELPAKARLIILLVGLAGILGVIFHSVIWQLLVQLKRRALALLLEKSFPELNDRLITAVETAEEIENNKKPEEEQPALTHAMLSRTLQETSKITETLQVQQVFNPKPMQRSVLFAGIALFSIAATAVASPGTFSHWSNAYMKLADGYWNRVNGLTVSIIAQPGDRIREFDEKKICKHAAGADLTILVKTEEGKEAPLQVMLSYRTVTGAHGKVMMSPTKDGKFRHTIGNLVDDLDFYITGGDFTTAEPYHIITVPEPYLEALDTECIYPEYTGWNSPGVGDETTFNITSSEVSVPMETELFLKARSTKPLVKVKIVSDAFELEIKRNSETRNCTGVCKFIDERGAVTKQVSVTGTDLALIDESGHLMTIPLFITQRYEAAAGSKSKTSRNILINQEDSLRIYMEDADGIINLEPARLKLRGIADLAPEIQTRLSGIGKAITRKAYLPFTGEVRDDYGLKEAHFEYRVNKETEYESSALKRSPAGEKTYSMNGTQQAPKERFDVLPFGLELNDILHVSLVAADKDHLNGPHITRGETYRMKVVSDEELLSILYQDELNLRRRFEQLIEELTRSRDDLALASTKKEAEESRSDQVVSESVQRTLNTVRKDKVETDAVRAAFEDLREEMVNNRVDTPQVRRRLDNNIIKPLISIIENDFVLTEEHLRALDFSFREKKTSQFTATDCVEDMDRLLANLRQVLLEMRKLESFQEVIELLKGIIQDQEELKKKTEAERKKKLIDLLN